MAENEIIEIAKRYALEQQWPWEDPVKVLPQRRFMFFGRPRAWCIMTNTNFTGSNVIIWIDDATRTVVNGNFIPL